MGERNAYAMLEAAKGDPIKQSSLLRRYLEKRQAQKQRMCDVCSSAALDIIKEHYPKLLRDLEV